MAFCRKCGKQLNDGAGFCDGCGMKLNIGMGSPGENQNGQKKKTGLIITVVMAVVALAVGVILIGNHVSKNNRYQAAIQIFNAGSYERASHEFTQLGNFKDSRWWRNQAQDELEQAALQEQLERDLTTQQADLHYGSSVNVGDIIRFGAYDWLVLDVQHGQALIITVGFIERRLYHIYQDSLESSLTWENSDIRTYLNGEFFENNFNLDERRMTNGVQVENKDNQWYGTPGGNDTVDRVFLLSIEEVVRYFGDSGKLRNRPGENSDLISDDYNYARVALNADALAGWWWLRSPGRSTGTFAYVTARGSVDLSGIHVNNNGGVRPALWINL